MKVKFLHHQGQWKPGDEDDLDDVTAARMIASKRAVPLTPAKPAKAATKKRSSSSRAQRPAPGPDAGASDPTTTAGPDAEA